MLRFGQILNQVIFLKNSTSCRVIAIDYDYRKFLKASRIHRGMNHSNAIFKKFLTAKSVSIKYHFSCREQLIYAMNVL